MKPSYGDMQTLAQSALAAFQAGAISIQTAIGMMQAASRVSSMTAKKALIDGDAAETDKRTVTTASAIAQAEPQPSGNTAA